MTTTPTLEVYLQPEQLKAALRKDATVGLTSNPKWLPPKYFYDARGSELFERITALPEYFPTRTERELLRRYSGGDRRGRGAGDSRRTRIRVVGEDTAAAGRGTRHGSLHTYVPQDVSVSALESAAEQIGVEFPNLTVRGVVSDFTESLHHLPRGGRRTIAFLGGTLGNMVPAERAEFLSGIADVLEPGGAPAPRGRTGHRSRRPRARLRRRGRGDRRVQP